MKILFLSFFHDDVKSVVRRGPLACTTTARYVAPPIIPPRKRRPTMGAVKFCPRWWWGCDSAEEGTNKIFSHVIYSIRIRISKIVITKKEKYAIDKDLPHEPHPGLSLTLSPPGLLLVVVGLMGETPPHQPRWQLSPQWYHAVWGRGP